MNQMTEDSVFSKCTTTKLLKDGALKISCKKGLWCVSGSNRLEVVREAYHYLAQYYHDGEYDSLLKKE